MGTVPSPSSDWPAASQGSVALPLLTVTFLIGIGLVSLVDAFPGDDEVVPLLDLPQELASGPFVLVAPGWETVLEQFDEPEQVTVIPPWGHLPESGWNYLVVLRDGMPMPRIPEGWDVAEERSIGEWQLVEVLNTQQAALEANYYDFAEHIDAARVFFRSPTGEITACDSWHFGRWSCGLDDWLWVGPTEQVLRDRSYSCIWAHPLARHELVIQFSGVPRGTRIIGRHGLSDVAVEVPEGAPVELTVRAGQNERTVVAENRRGFNSYQLRLGADEPDELDVEFVITAEDDGRRHFCFDGGMQGIGARQLQGQSEQTESESEEPPGVGEELGTGEPSEAGEQLGTGESSEADRPRSISRDRRVVRPGTIDLDLRPTRTRAGPRERIELPSRESEGTGGAL